MIEIELKYELNELTQKLDLYDLSKTKEQEDIYYDTKNYDLLRNGNFCRIRDNKLLDFKLAVGDTTHLYCKETSFPIDSISSKQHEIRSVFKSIGLSHDKDFSTAEELIKQYDLIVLVPINKKRYVYNVDESISISFDYIAKLGCFVEAEKCIADDCFAEGDALQQIKKELIDLLEKKMIISKEDKMVTIGYVELYLKKYNPKAYELGLFKD